mgnify:CR=1 FL=1
MKTPIRGGRSPRRRRAGSMTNQHAPPARPTCRTTERLWKRCGEPVECECARSTTSRGPALIKALPVVYRRSGYPGSAALIHFVEGAFAAIASRPCNARARRGHSKRAPGSALRPGATCSWPTTSASGYRPRNAFNRRISARYCARSKRSPSRPSSSMPIDQSLQLSRPRQCDAPACHAR